MGPALAREGAIEIDQRLTAALADKDVQDIADEDVVGARLDIFVNQALFIAQWKVRPEHPKGIAPCYNVPYF